MNTNILISTEGLSKEEWLRYRKQGLGGSDISCLLGINKWKSELELWLDKTNQVNESIEINSAMEWGTILEPVIRKHFEKVTGLNVLEIPAIIQHPEHKYMLSDVDGIVVNDAGEPIAILEIKTASEYKRNEWEGDNIPDYYMTQIQHYMYVCDMPKCFVAVLIGGNTFKIFEVDADPEIQAMLVEVERQFWDKVQNNIRPTMDGSDAAKNLLDRIYRGGVEEQIVMPDEAIEWIDQYLEAAATEDSAKALKQEASNHLKEILGDYDRATCYDHIITWKPVSTERLDTKALKENEPEIYQKYVKVTTSRRFTLK